MLIREVKKQPDGTDVDFEGTVASCKAPVLTGGLYHQFVQLADSSGKIWAKFTLGTKFNPLRNGANIKVKKAKYSTVGLEVFEYTIPTTSEPPVGSHREYSPAHPADEMTKEDWAAKDMRMAKMSSLNNATRLVVCLAETFGTEGAKGLDTEQLKKIANEFLTWIYETETEQRKEQGKCQM